MFFFFSQSEVTVAATSPVSAENVRRGVGDGRNNKWTCMSLWLQEMMRVIDFHIVLASGWFFVF